MSLTRSTWRRAPRELRRPLTQLDNIALVPASELASLKEWQDRARQLPAGETLVVVPHDNVKLQRVGRKIGLSLKQRGRRSLIATASLRLGAR